MVWTLTGGSGEAQRLPTTQGSAKILIQIGNASTIIQILEAAFVKEDIIDWWSCGQCKTPAQLLTTSSIPPETTCGFG